LYIHFLLIVRRHSISNSSFQTRFYALESRREPMLLPSSHVEGRSDLIMTRRAQLVLISLCVLTICSAASHFSVRWLKIRVGWGGRQSYGAADGTNQAVLHCSSVGYDGLDWGRISEAIGGGIDSRAIAGSSPSEWEVMDSKLPALKCTFIVLSAVDLNEYALCDVRGEIVPLWRTLQDCRKSRPEWSLCRRILSHYPLAFVRKLFPTVGRSDGVMVGIRANLRKLVGGSAAPDSGEAPKFGNTKPSENREKISDWPEARVERRLALVRAACQGKFGFNGPKKLAVLRLLDRARRRGGVVLVVMRVSPAYQREFLKPQVLRELDAEIAEFASFCPLKLVRLDHVAELENSDLYSDLVHLNMYGQRLATEALLESLDVGAARVSRTAGTN
jgi:hypothetical protein